jgi:hypothetical protein
MLRLPWTTSARLRSPRSAAVLALLLTTRLAPARSMLAFVTLAAVAFAAEQLFDARLETTHADTI